MEYTPNLNLRKPGENDYYSVDDANQNANIIDTAMSTKVDKVSGKGLSSEDFTTAEKTTLAQHTAQLADMSIDDVGSIIYSYKNIGGTI